LRVEQGSPLKAGPVELGQDLRQLQYVEPSRPSTGTESGPGSSSAQSSWADKRHKIYQDTRGVFLVHVIQPSDEPGQLYLRRSAKVTHLCSPKVTHAENTIWNRIWNLI
jgi:hypothetical protein